VAQRSKQLQRNFQGYSTRAGSDIYAFGMSSISQIPEAYWQNEKELPKYQEAVTPAAFRCSGLPVTDETAPARDHHARHVRPVAGLRGHVATARIRFEEHFAAELEALAPLEATLVRRKPGSLEVTTLDACSSATSRCASTTPCAGGRAEAFEDDLMFEGQVRAGRTED